ncbi:hypothetical protein [Candidatus Finniella inopinata]|uniref:DUF465 domain-containing protein n=1 Tax=Candidatus Finniella inopinata TaxID=1696036 RepID=A0A4Q7DGS5_9PROT|nr:hypothetical protein [Candidatus Finniella inopinata]RZI45408.1 hypothetical protein EQU50_07230 [Candidatus Finniella inopinata]
MISLTTAPELQSQLQQCQQQKMQLEHDMQNSPRKPRGTVDFDLYRMKRVKTELQDRITKLNSVLHPNIIA